MKTCPQCSFVYDDNATTCTNCGSALVTDTPAQPAPPVQNNNDYNPYGAPQVKYCTHCGNACDPLAVICVKCGAPFQTPAAQNDVPSTGLKVLSFLFPLVALILFLVNNDKKPISAKAYGKMGIIGFAISMVFSIFSWIISFALLGFSSSVDYYYSIFNGLFF